MRVVIDPNVLISALITPLGVCGRLLEVLPSQGFQIIVSPLLLAELTGVANRPKFGAYITPGAIDAFLDQLRRRGVAWPDPPAPLQAVSEDPGDEYLITPALASHATALISGDPHLTRLSGIIPVKTPRRFLDEITGGKL